MNKSKPNDLASSVRARLTNLSRASGEDFQLLLTRYGIERLLYRISESEYADRFVLKGAVLFQIWTGIPHRPTRDLDLLASGDPSMDAYRILFTDLCAIEVTDDGLKFDPASVSVNKIKEDDEYEGVRIKMDAKLQNARIRLQVDVGFGDTVNPPPTKILFPSFLDFPTATLHIYPKETVVAEKFQAMVALGIANTRMKDFFDIWVLSKQFAFKAGALRLAILATFERRQTEFPIELPLALTDGFAADSSKSIQWNAFQKRIGEKHRNLAFDEVIADLRQFLFPFLDSKSEGDKSSTSEWPAGGPWSK